MLLAQQLQAICLHVQWDFSNAWRREACCPGLLMLLVQLHAFPQHVANSEYSVQPYYSVERKSRQFVYSGAFQTPGVEKIAVQDF